MKRILALCLAVTMLNHGSSASDSFRDCDLCPQMVRVPSGESVTGADADALVEAGVPRDVAEAAWPRQTRRVDHAFAAGVTEVTRAQYAAFVADTGRADGARCFVWDETTAAWDNRAGVTWRDPGFVQAHDHPVVCVSWDDALAYANWLADITGQSYRLLSEREWAYAAQSGRGPPWDSGLASACAWANVNDVTRGIGETFSCDDGFAATAPVGSFPANAFGLHDMSGNVWEWVSDCFKSSDDGSCAQRVNRGGSFADPPWRLHPAVREWDPPHGRYALHGFRVAREIR